MPIKQIDVTDLDFADIKEAIKDYYQREEGPFKDFDFDGSGVNMILDMLAYNTHYNAVLAHLTANESFLSSAQLRKNVVARAKTLGYNPHGTSSAETEITLSNLDSSILSIPEGTIFNTTDSVNNSAYSFVTFEEIGEPDKPFVIHEGSIRTSSYVFDNTISNLRFEIPHENIDTTKIVVSVRQSAASTQQDIYTKFYELPGVDSNSTVYFINENPNGKFEISFGDGVLGKKPDAGSIISIKYLTTNGAAANGLSSFTTVDPIFNGVNKPTITSTGATTGGSSKESLESIRSNAPLQFVSQNRAVTVDDYIALVRKNTSVSSISVWGGEDNNPPVYGTVFISAKPHEGVTLSDEEKTRLMPILNSKGILTVKPEFVDPDITYLYFDIFTKYNSSLTNLGSAGISSLVRSGIETFSDDELEKFDKMFRYSDLLSYITNLDNAITSSYVRVFCLKGFTALNTNTSSYQVNFNFPLAVPEDPTESLITSSAYVNDGVKYYFKDEPSSVDNIRNIYRYYINSSGSEIVDEQFVGTVDTDTGMVQIKDFNVTADTAINIFARPESNDVVPKRNQILEVDIENTVINSQIDTLATRGSAGAIEYTTTPRER
jgi:hypothetical protein